MSFDFTVLSLAAHPLEDTPSSLINMNGYMATADLTACNPPTEIQLGPGTTQTSQITGIWSGAGSAILTSATSSWFGFNFAVQGSSMQSIGIAPNGELNIYFSRNGTSNGPSQTITLQILLQEPLLASSSSSSGKTPKPALATFVMTKLPPVMVGSVETTISAAPGAPNSTQLIFSIDGNTQLFAVKLMTAPNSNHKLFSIQAQSPTFGMQAMCCPFAPQVKLRFPTLRHRMAPTLQTHTAFDTGKFIPSASTLQANRLSAEKPGGYVVTRFDALSSASRSLIIQHASHYATADTSVTSASLVGKVVLHKPPHTISASSAQAFWGNASILAAPAFTVDEDGTPASVVTLFFTPLTYEDVDGTSKLTVTKTSLTLWGPAYGGATGAQILLSTNSGNPITSEGWVLSGDGQGGLTLLAPADVNNGSKVLLPSNLLLPYIELTAATASLPPLLSKVESSGFPIQAFTAELAVPASIAELDGPCFDYQAVKNAGVVLYTDVAGNMYRFQDADATFNLTNEALDVAVRTVKPIKSVSYGRFFTETRPSNTSNAWARTTDGNGATVYRFEEYTPASDTEYPKRGTMKSVILLSATNYSAAGVATATGYVSCATYAKANQPVFAPAAASSATPFLVTRAAAVAAGVQWGVVQIGVDQSKTSRGVSLQAQAGQGLGLVYSDKNMEAPMPLVLASSRTVSGALGVLDATGSYIAHGVWQGLGGASGNTIVYDTTTMRVRPLDLHNVIAGTGFTPANALMQWIAHLPPVQSSKKEMAATLSQLAVSRKTTAAAAALVANATAALYRQAQSPAQSSFNLSALLSSVSALSEVTQAHAVIAENASRALTAGAAASAAAATVLQVKAAVKPVLQFKNGVFLPRDAPAPFSPGLVAGCLVGIVVLSLLCLFMARRFATK